jgi:hypothetical protein
MSVTYGGDKITFDDGTSIASGYTLFRNRIINGAMEIDQRNSGASVSANDGSFAVDRTYFNMQTNSKGTGIQSSDAPAGFKNSLLYTNGSAYTVGASETYGIIQNIEGTNIADLAWGTANAKTVTLSFWVKSSVTGLYGGVAKTTTGSPAYTYAFSYTINSANTWEYKTVTIPGPTVGTWVTTTSIGIRLGFGLGNGSNNSIAANSWTAANVWSVTGAVSVLATANATWQITGIQLEVGSYATTFERRPYGMELLLCQRYFYQWSAVNANSAIVGSGQAFGSTSAYILLKTPVTMRVPPTTFSSAGSFGSNNASGGGLAVTSISLVSSWTNENMITLQAAVSSGWTAGNAALMNAGADATCRLNFSSEY